VTRAPIVARLIALLPGVAIAAILVTLVTAAFVLPSRPAPTTTATATATAQSALEAALPMAVAVLDEERAASSARGMRIRDVEPVDIAAPQVVPVAAPSEPQPVEEEIAPAPTDATPEPTPVPTPAPTPRPTAPPPPRTAAPPVITTSTTEAELRMLVLINASRTAGGLVPLAADAAVAAVARSHSQVESQVGYVYHDGPDGTAASRDVPACGTGWYGENTGKIWNGNVDALHIEFMAEPWAPINHRTNIMDPNFRRVGIGAVQGRDALYMTMVFCR
jgi:uncharacterized protein YkwD